MTVDEMLAEIANLTEPERVRLLEALINSSDYTLTPQAFDALFHPAGYACPACGERGVKNGKTRGVQRYKCTTCGITYNDKTGTFFALSHKNITVWFRYLALFLKQYSIRRIERELGISHTTAYAWRVRLLSHLSRRHVQAKLPGIVEADETYVAESFKGNRADLTRPARKRGSQVHKRGISSEQIPIMCAVDRQQHIYLSVAGKGKLTVQQVAIVFTNVLGPDAALCTDQLRTYKLYADTHSVELHQSQRMAARSGLYHIQHVNALHARLKRFLRGYNGVSTKRLPLYLSWFTWLEQQKEVADRERYNHLLMRLV